MRRKFLSCVALVLVMTLVACGPKSEPGLSVTDMQNTAVVLALTNIVMTQSALSTNTPVPATPIPVTDVATLVTLPTSAQETPTLAPITNSNTSPTPDCYQPAPAELLGTTVQIRLVNKSDGPVDLSMGMYAPNDRGECFTFAFFRKQKRVRGCNNPVRLLLDSRISKWAHSIHAKRRLYMPGLRCGGPRNLDQQ